MQKASLLPTEGLNIVTESTAAPGLLLPAEVAEQLRTGRNYVYRRIADGTLKHINIGTAERPKFRIRPEDLAAFVEQLQGAESQTQPLG